MQFVTLISIIASALQVQAVDYVVATVFNADTTAAPGGTACTPVDESQMVCLDPANFGRTIFDTTVGVPAKTWTTPSATDFYYSTTDITATTCADAATPCFNDPATDSVSTSPIQVQAVPDIANMSSSVINPGNCIVNMLYGDYPFVMASDTRLSGRYTNGSAAATSPQDCQKQCIGVVAPAVCDLWTYLFKLDEYDVNNYTTGTNCFFQTKAALEALSLPIADDNCGFDHRLNATIGFPSCSADSNTKICALYTGYAVSGEKVCNLDTTPTATWMQTNSICSTVTPTTDPSAPTSTAAVVTTIVDPSAPTQTTTNTGSGVSAQVVMTSIAALAIGVSTLLL